MATTETRLVSRVQKVKGGGELNEKSCAKTPDASTCRTSRRGRGGAPSRVAIAGDAWDSAEGATNWPELIHEGAQLIDGNSYKHPLVGTRRCSGGQHEWEVNVILDRISAYFSREWEVGVILGVVAGAVGDLDEALNLGAIAAGFYGFRTHSGSLLQGDAGPAVGELKTSTTRRFTLRLDCDEGVLRIVRSGKLAASFGGLQGKSLRLAAGLNFAGVRIVSYKGGVAAEASARKRQREETPATEKPIDKKIALNKKIAFRKPPENAVIDIVAVDKKIAERVNQARAAATATAAGTAAAVALAAAAAAAAAIAAAAAAATAAATAAAKKAAAATAATAAVQLRATPG
jgi:hypothetical protein